MVFVKHFCRLICNEDLEKEDVIEYFDIIQSIVPTKMVTAYDEDGDVMSAQVMVYDSDQEQNIYEIILTEQINMDEGEEISEQLHDAFPEFDFEFETSLEI